MKVVFLYTELASYLLACVNKFASKYEGKVHLIHWPVNSEAPFVFESSPELNFVNRKDLTAKDLLRLVEKINPDVIYCSGWIDKSYLYVCKRFRNKIPVVLGLDNQWRSTIKQRIASFFSKYYLLNCFNSAWVPGQLQYIYAKHLGFDENKIYKGFYSADVNYYQKFNLLKDKPKRFIYVGRYYDFKGITDLWSAFIQLQEEKPNEWELWCLGTGSIKPLIHPKIKHFGFVQPKDMTQFISNTSVFILPSRFEPWGVVVHEFASAGFPLICSSKVGSAEIFVKDGENGFIFPSGDISCLKDAMKKIISLNDEQLQGMSQKSIQLAMQVNPDKWADTLMMILRSGV